MNKDSNSNTNIEIRKKNDKIKIVSIVGFLLIVILALTGIKAEEPQEEITAPVNTTIASTIEVDDENFSQENTINRSVILLGNPNWASIVDDLVENEAFYDIKDSDFREELESMTERYLQESITGIFSEEFDYLNTNTIAANYTPQNLQITPLVTIAGVNWEEANTFQGECLESTALLHFHDEESVQKKELHTDLETCVTVDWRQQNNFSVFVLSDNINRHSEPELSVIVIDIENTDEGLRIKTF